MTNYRNRMFAQRNRGDTRVFVARHAERRPLHFLFLAVALIFPRIIHASCWATNPNGTRHVSNFDDHLCPHLYAMQRRTWRLLEPRIHAGASGQARKPKAA